MSDEQASPAKDGTGAPRPAPEPHDQRVTTRHTLDTAGGPLHYTATAGRMVLVEEIHTDGVFDGPKAKAELFIVAYTKDDADPATRPVTFAFNGGPGSSSVWLHLGLLGPRRVLMGDAGDLTPPPYGLTDNRETLLEHTDLVFIDPVSTGYSRVAQGGKPAEYHGYQRDLESVGEMIRLWTSRGDRWMSPKFLAGESYGTTRASALAAHLQKRYGLYLNGIMLISSVLDMGTIRFTPGNPLSPALILPTYACIAHYHGHRSDVPLRQVRTEAEVFAASEYSRALERGDRIDPSERDSVVGTYAQLTGLSPDFIRRCRLRVEPARFFAELLRDRGLLVGRLDGRFTGWNPDGGAEHPDHDPSYAAIHGPYAAALNHYVRDELGFESDLPYEILTDRVSPWSYSDFEGRHVSVADELAAAMRQNRHLRVHVAFGAYDAATPYFAAEYVLAHLALPDELRGQIETRFYESGHMTYIHEPTRVAQSADLARFVTAGSAGTAD